MKLAICILLSIMSLQSFASLLVTPSRIAFDARDRTKEVILLNTSNQVRSYKLEWINQRQNTQGGYTLLTEGEMENFGIAEKYLRFSPRRVTLQPGESQKIKIMARRKGDMSMPEYRSHLKFIALPPDLTNGSTENETSEGISMKLHLLLSYTIPVILRTQEPDREVSISSMAFNTDIKGKQTLTLEVSKRTPTSVYGDFTVYHISNNEEKAVAFLNGVNLFHEQEVMKLTIPMHHKLDKVSGRLKIVYKGSGEFADTILDENSIVP